MDDYYWRLKVGTGCKYDPTQPRVPAGEPTGGQWTSSRQVIKNLAKEIADSPVEKHLIIGQDGTILDSVEGTGHNVSLPIESRAKMGDSISIHNHPGFVPGLSPEDLTFGSLNDVAEVIVVSKELGSDSHWMYSLKRPPDGWGLYRQRLKYEDRFMELYKQKYKPTMSIREKDIAYQEAWRQFADEIGATYERTELK